MKRLLFVTIAFILIFISINLISSQNKKWITQGFESQLDACNSGDISISNFCEPSAQILFEMMISDYSAGNSQIKFIDNDFGHITLEMYTDRNRISYRVAISKDEKSGFFHVWNVEKMGGFGN